MAETRVDCVARGSVKAACAGRQASSIWFDEGEAALAKSRRGSLLYKKILIPFSMLMMVFAVFGEANPMGAQSNVVEGVWCSDFPAAMAYAESNNVPLVVIWSNPGCWYCEKLQNACKSDEFVSWQAEKKYVMVFAYGKSTAKDMAAYKWIKSVVKLTEYPFVGVYCRSNLDGDEVRAAFTGRTGKMPSTVGSLDEQLMNSIESFSLPNGGGDCSPLPDGGPYSRAAKGVEWTFMVADGKAILGAGPNATAVPLSFAGDIVIPYWLDHTPVRGIGQYGFSGCSGLTDVRISAYIQTIGESAFRGCDGLTALVLPGNVTDVGAYAFADCNGLTTVAMSARIIGDGAFFGCGSLSEVTLSEGVERIGRQAFYGCSGLKYVEVPATVTSIGEGAFLDSGCSTIKFLGAPPDGLSQAGICRDCVIRYCVWHEDEWLPVLAECDFVKAVAYARPDGGPYAETVDGVRWNYTVRSGKASIEGAEGSVEALAIPERLGGRAVTSIGGYAFAGCSGLTEIVIPSHVMSVGEGVFAGCSGLTSVTISEGVTSIGYEAFASCSGLTEIVIPSSVTSIGEGAFSACSGLRSVTVPQAAIFQRGQCAEGIVFGDIFGESASITNVVIQEGTREIGSCVFEGMWALESVTIPSSVASIGEMAFAGCSGLTSVTIPEGVTSIGYEAFAGCSGLTEIVIPSSVTSVGEGAFSACSGLRSVTVPQAAIFRNWNLASCAEEIITLASIFMGVESITNVVIQEGTTEIGPRAFEGMWALESVTIPSSVASIGEMAFAGCSGLTSVTIPEGVTSIGYEAFAGCSSLTSVVIPQSVMSIGEGAFDGTPFRASLPKGLLVLGGVVCGYDGECPTVLEIPSGVVAINPWAFTECIGLTSVSMPNGVVSIGEGAFAGCSGLTSVSVPDSVVSIGPYAFDSTPFLEHLVEGLMDELAMVGKVAYKWWGVCPAAVVLPEGMVGLADAALAGCDEIRSVAVPFGVKHIGDSAFDSCRGLTSVVMAASVMSVGYDAFADCPALKVIEFEGAPPLGLAEAGLDSDVVIRYNAAYADQWLPVIEKCGCSNATAIGPMPVPDSDEVEVSFIGACGVSSMGTATYPVSSIYGQLPEAKRDGFTFAGWYTSLEGTHRVCAFSKVDPSVTTLYARWTDAIDRIVEVTNVVDQVHDVENVVTVYVTNIVEQAHEVEKVVAVYTTNVVEQLVTVEMTNYVDSVGTDSGVVAEEVRAFEPQGGFDGSAKRTFNGIAYDADAKLCGLVQISTAKATKKGVKVSGFLMLEDGKKQTIKSVTANEVDGYLSAVSSVGKLGSASVVIGADGFRGTIGGLTIVSAVTSEDAGIVKGSVTVSYFDATTNKMKTRKVTVGGVTAEGMSTGSLTEKGKDTKGYLTVWE